MRNPDPEPQLFPRKTCAQEGGWYLTLRRHRSGHAQRSHRLSFERGRNREHKRKDGPLVNPGQLAAAALGHCSNGRHFAVVEVGSSRRSSREKVVGLPEP